MDKKGFSLVEVLLYVAILAVVAGLFAGILATSTRVELHEVAGAEVSNQLNFVLQTIQRLVRESSNIEIAATDDDPKTTVTEVSYLKLRMPDPAKDPTCISLIDDGTIRVIEGPAVNQNDCKSSDSSDAITTPAVIVPISPSSGLVFKKFTNYPAHDSVQIDLTMNFNSTNPQSQISRTLTTAIGRVSAATFDSDLIPGGNYDIGLFTQPWKDLFVTNLDVSGGLYVGGNVDITGTITQTGNYGGGRGMMTIGAFGNDDCNSICKNNHGFNTCQFALSLPVGNPPSPPIQLVACGVTDYKRICFCQ